jgi:NTE family protein
VLARPIIVLLIALASAGIAAAQDPVAEKAPGRPRIGLVLGGGGARGAAHIGVLKVLEELHIPVDCVAGTSMGALVGAAYATGMSSAEIERLVTGINWQETFGSGATRDLQPVHIKTAHATYSNKLEVGLKKKRLLTPGGLVASQPIDSILRTIVGRARYQDSFDDLPIPFRAIATDIRTGEMLILDGGDLAAAMRASMAVPGAFAPVRIDDRVLVDGGMVRNLPVDVARDMCADVVIASSLEAVQPDPEKLQGVLAILGQTIDIMIKNNERAQLATLKPTDVPVMITIEGMTSGDFDKVAMAIPAGELAARKASASLARYSLSPEAYANWRAGLTGTSELPPAALAEVRIAGLNRVNPKVVRRLVQTPIGQPVDDQSVVADAQRIFAMGDFAGVDYSVEESPGGPVLEFRPREKPWGPDYLRFDLGLMSATGGDTGYILRVDHTRTWINSLGGRWNNALQVGRTALIETGFLQPLDLDQRFFIAPGLGARRELEDLYSNDDRVARYEKVALEATLDFGLSLSNRAELRLGLQGAQTDYRVDTGTLLLPEFNNVSSNGVTSRFTYDSRDSPYLPTRGSFARVTYFSAEPSLGADDSYMRAEFIAQKAFSFRGNLLYLEAAGGSDLDSDAPGYDLFALGGADQLAGFQDQELRGHEYAFGRVAYLWKVTDLQTLLGQSLYAGFSLEAGNMFGRIDGTPAQGAIIGSSIFFGGRTPLGPLKIVFGMAEGGHKAGYVLIGRPLRER